jgi:hypothetical protein
MDSQIPAGQNEAEWSSDIAVEEAVHGSSADSWRIAASHPALTEDLALTLLKRVELSPECLVALSKNSAVAKYRKVRRALVAHMRTPRHVSLPLLRLLYTFDLMQVALMPTLAADIKRAAEEVLRAKLETISSGEKLTLARRASGRIAAELLLDKEVRVMQAALENPRLTEAAVAKILVRSNTTSPLVEAVCHHPKWSHARDIRIALLRDAKTPLARALEFARSLPAQTVREILRSSRLPQSTKACLLQQLQEPLASSSRAASQAQ